jgi:hypothetical protein
MDDTVLSERDAIEIVAYLVSAAELAVIEPELYGSFRLVDGAGRVLALLAAHGAEERRPLYARLRDEIDRKKVLMMWDRESFLDFVARLPRDVVDKLLLPQSGAGEGTRS